MPSGILESGSDIRNLAIPSTKKNPLLDSWSLAAGSSGFRVVSFRLFSGHDRGRAAFVPSMVGMMMRTVVTNAIAEAHKVLFQRCGPFIPKRSVDVKWHIVNTNRQRIPILRGHG